MHGLKCLDFLVILDFQSPMLKFLHHSFLVMFGGVVYVDVRLRSRVFFICELAIVLLHEHLSVGLSILVSLLSLFFSHVDLVVYLRKFLSLISSKILHLHLVLSVLLLLKNESQSVGLYLDLVLWIFDGQW